MFVNGHNQLRNQQALGQIGGIFKDTAADMATMVRKCSIQNQKYSKFPFKFHSS